MSGMAWFFPKSKSSKKPIVPLPPAGGSDDPTPPPAGGRGTILASPLVMKHEVPFTVLRL